MGRDQAGSPRVAAVLGLSPDGWEGSGGCGWVEDEQKGRVRCRVTVEEASCEGLNCQAALQNRAASSKGLLAGSFGRIVFFLLYLLPVFVDIESTSREYPVP